ncbi:MAG: RHS repeat domain-containing protein, partial [Verrucomicrobiota bacterium]
MGPNSPLVGQIDFNNGGSVHMTTVKEYDYLNRLKSISSVTTGGTALPITFTYSYNDANQRTRRADVDGSYWVYQYDALGQVTSGKKYWADGTPVAGQQFEYTFDDIGNRQSTKSGGDENGANLRLASYTANNLNQYTSRGVPGYVDILGLALATNTVTVNGTTAYRKGEYFRNERSVNNSSTALWTNIIVAAAGETSVTGNVFVAKSPEAFGYDLDGNLTNDGRWVFTWDAENRLTQIESLTNGPTASKRRVTWQYDGKGRRQRQTTYDLSSGSPVVTEDLKFVNDGRRCLAELNGTNNALVRRYTWGLDLSGSMDGAGGVGGLLWMKADSDPQFCA